MDYDVILDQHAYMLPDQVRLALSPVSVAVAP
jgi:hypothetical protein